MTTYASETYGDRTAGVYDDLYESFEPPAEQIRLLAELAGNGPVVEIGSGTGRVTLPLAEHVPVIAVDASAEMTAQLAKKVGDLDITPVTADAAHFVADARTDLVFACFNTFFLLAQEATQRSFLHNAAGMLSFQGTLIIETFVPRPGQRLPDGPHPGFFPEDQAVALKQQTADRVVLFTAQNDSAAQEFRYTELVFHDGAPPRLLPGQMRYWMPEQIDALAAEAGLLLRERWADWDRTPYDALSSPKHVSMYRLAG